MRNEIIVYIICAVLSILYIYKLYKEIFFQTSPQINSSFITLPEIPPLEIETVKKYYFDDAELWNIKPEEIKTQLGVVEKENKLSKNCINYSIEKIGKIYEINNTFGKVFQFFGIVERNGKKFAVFYDKTKKENKILLVKEGQKIDRHLILKKITENSIIIDNKKSCKNENQLILEIFEISDINNIHY